MHMPPPRECVCACVCATSLLLIALSYLTQQRVCLSWAQKQSKQELLALMQAQQVDYCISVFWKTFSNAYACETCGLGLLFDCLMGSTWKQTALLFLPPMFDMCMHAAIHMHMQTRTFLTLRLHQGLVAHAAFRLRLRLRLRLILLFNVVLLEP